MTADELLAYCEHNADDIYVRFEVSPGRWDAVALAKLPARAALSQIRLWLTSGHVPILVLREQR